MTTPCAFCGHPDAQHRVRDAMLDRWLAGESIWSLAKDYDEAPASVEAMLRCAIQERLQQRRRAR